MKIPIKNMVCDRCTLAIRNVLRDIDIEPVAVKLGEVDLGDRVLEKSLFASATAALRISAGSSRR